MPLVLGVPALAFALFQFCEILSAPEVSRWAGPIIDILLDYVGNVQLCSRLKEHIDSFEDWAVIREKAGTECRCCWTVSLPASGPGLGHVTVTNIRGASIYSTQALCCVLPAAPLCDSLFCK